MKILDLQFQKVLKENRRDFIDSLKLTSIDVEQGIWALDALDHNAYVGAIALILFASQESIPSQCGNRFLRTIAENLNGEENFSIMAWIYAAYIRAGQFPPYAIIQHVVDPTLFREYCVFLRKWLHRYIHGDFSGKQTSPSLFSCP